MSIFYINPVSLIQTLTMALDLAVDGVSLHQKRTAIICSHLVDRLNLQLTEEHTLLSAALLHDIGAASSSEERRKLADPDMGWTKDDIYQHAEKGYQLLINSDTFLDMAEAIRYHHDNWEGNNPSGLAGQNIPLSARIIHLADRIEVNTKKTGPILHNVQRVQQLIQEGSGILFDPDLVDVFMDCSVKECFWLDLTLPDLATTINEKMKMGTTPLTMQDMLHVAEIFATIIDRMSRFTATHSRSVSGVAVFLAKWNGFSQNELHLMRIAGLLHDLGKLSIPNAILEKPSPLTYEEQLIVRQHTYYTFMILDQIEQFKTVAQWAAWHHETLDGKGYPFKLDEASLTLGARIMAVADIFVALAENRPYRKKLPKESIFKIMDCMVKENKITDRIVQSLFDNYNDAELVVKTMESLAHQTLYSNVT
jgi:putative nucleotidyltransferase with HDIG domain